MEKKAVDLLRQAEQTMSKQTAEIEKLRKQHQKLAVHKLAFDVAAAMLVKEQIEDSDFYSTVEQLKERPVEDLQKRAEILSVMDPSKDLALGNVDTRQDGHRAVGVTPESRTSETSPSKEATDVGRGFIDSVLED